MLRVLGELMDTRVLGGFMDTRVLGGFMDTRVLAGFIHVAGYSTAHGHKGYSADSYLRQATRRDHGYGGHTQMDTAGYSAFIYTAGYSAFIHAAGMLDAFIHTAGIDMDTAAYSTGIQRLVAP